MIPFTPEQKERFIEHLCNCHSWYKHLSLIKGGEFILFLDEEAGLDYPSHHPVLPFGNSQAGYRKAFGFLTYCWKTEEEIYYHRDDGKKIYTQAESTSELNDAVRIQLFPYLSDEFLEAIPFHESDFEQIILEKTHEGYECLSRIFLLKEKQTKYWREVLTEEEQDAYFEGMIETVPAKEYESLETELVHELELIQLQEKEKISYAIDQLLK
ncbi:MAG: hypothetical protein ACO1N0_06730 [Fluviicola sp.]